MINKEKFVRLIQALERDEEYKMKLNSITRKYNQENCFCFNNKDFSEAFDILLREALDNVEWMYDCVWSFILENKGEIKFYYKENDKDVELICDSAEKLYDFFVSEMERMKQKN